MTNRQVSSGVDAYFHRQVETLGIFPSDTIRFRHMYASFQGMEYDPVTGNILFVIGPAMPKEGAKHLPPYLDHADGNKIPTGYLLRMQ